MRSQCECQNRVTWLICATLVWLSSMIFFFGELIRDLRLEVAEMPAKFVELNKQDAPRPLQPKEKNQPVLDNGPSALEEFLEGRRLPLDHPARWIYGEEFPEGQGVTKIEKAVAF